MVEGVCGVQCLANAFAPFEMRVACETHTAYVAVTTYYIHCRDAGQRCRRGRRLGATDMQGYVRVF